jgi:lysophospholipase L1-like esterase
MFTGEPKGSRLIVDKMGKSNKLVRITLNDLGFRVKKQLPKQKTNDELRIFVLGGSTVFNGIPLSNSIPGQLEQLFHHDGYDNVNVYNFGVVSYVSGQELSLLLHTVSDYQPDTIIIYGGGNDIFQPYYFDPRPGYPYNFMLYEAGLSRIKQSSSVGQLFSSILYKSTLLKTIFKHSLTSGVVPIDLIRKNYNYKTEEWEISIVTEYINNLDKMCKLAKSFDFKLVVFLQPMIYFKSTHIGNEKEMLDEEAFQNYIKRQYERTRMLLKDLNIKYANEDKCSFVDLSYALQDYDKETFWDYIHIDNEGNKVIATKIYDYMKHKKILKLK